MLFILICMDVDFMHPSMVDGRKRFVETNFSQVVDFCSLDKTLSGGWYPPTPDDYDYLDWDTMAFNDLNYLKQIHPQYKESKILGVIKSPDEQKLANESIDDLLGFDILDKLNHYSLITNCGGFPELFANSELNQYALLNKMEEAYSIKDALRTNYKDDYHCQACEVWAVFRVH